MHYQKEILICVFFISVIGLSSGKSYIVSADRANYFQALINCKQVGMQLASPQNAEEDAAISSLLGDIEVGGGNGYWLGGTNLQNPDVEQFFWLPTGKPVVYTNWTPNQPDNENGLEHCIEWGYFHSSLQRGWNDWACEKKIKYICETAD